MKKTFKLTDPKKHTDRVLEAVKHEIRKYMKRESKKKLSDSKHFYWGFDCKVNTDVVEEEMLIKKLDEVHQSGATEVYVEVLAKEVEKPLKEEV
jgi:hypothetical protein